jgi:protein-ribulosamine 3-kinase
MAVTEIKSLIYNKLLQLYGLKAGSIEFESVGGGCINETYKISFNEQQLFCKVNSATKFPHLFEKEGHGLNLIARQHVIKVPKVINCFEAAGKQVLLLEWIKEGERTEDFWTKFGERLAALHQVTNEQFGLDEDNYMGSVVQPNQPSAKWTDFFSRQRLEPLVEQCISKGLLSSRHQSLFVDLYKKLSSVFPDDQQPALVHGDLWSGNFMCDEKSEPVLIDTASYFGHPSVDLGMSTLFGGFRNGFYEAYHYHSPFPSNHKEQWEVCNLYPLLIHLILFGSSYLSQIETILHRYC